MAPVPSIQGPAQDAPQRPKIVDTPERVTAPALPVTPATNSNPTKTSATRQLIDVNPDMSSKPAAARSAQRFVMNKVEKAWILIQLIVYGAPVQKMKTLDATSAKVAEDAQTRHVPDNQIIFQQNSYGMSWRRVYMALIGGENVRDVANSVPDMAKKVVVASLEGSEVGGGPVARVRGSENDAQHVLDQAILDYKHEASRRTMTTDDDAARVLSRTQESRAQKDKRNRERKAAFERNKRRRADLRQSRERRRLSADVQYLRALTRIANAASASAALQRRQSEQFGSLVNLFAQSKNLPVQQAVTPLPPPLPTDLLCIDPDLLDPPAADELLNFSALLAYGSLRCRLCARRSARLSIV